jgi:hypothetical protein
MSSQYPTNPFPAPPGSNLQQQFHFPPDRMSQLYTPSHQQVTGHFSHDTSGSPIEEDDSPVQFRPNTNSAGMSDGQSDSSRFVDTLTSAMQLSSEEKEILHTFDKACVSASLSSCSDLLRLSLMSMLTRPSAAWLSCKLRSLSNPEPCLTRWSTFWRKIVRCSKY